MAGISHAVCVEQERPSHTKPKPWQGVWYPSVAETDDDSCAEDVGEEDLVRCTYLNVLPPYFARFLWTCRLVDEANGYVFVISFPFSVSRVYSHAFTCRDDIKCRFSDT